MPLTYNEIAKTLDHALLVPTLTWAEIEAGCERALAYNVASVCLMPFAARRCAEILRGSSIVTSTTIGFPHGGQVTDVKRYEAERAIADGCGELDMVVNISQVLSRNWEYVVRDLAAVTELAHAAKVKVKAIFETSYLEELHKRELCRLCSELAVDWVKTSTGFGPGGATLEDVRLMRQCVAPAVQVKAAGGVRQLENVLAFRTAGATRCGTSRTWEILDECRARLGMPSVGLPPGPTLPSEPSQTQRAAY